jgi:hypothetical protein
MPHVAFVLGDTTRTYRFTTTGDLGRIPCVPLDYDRYSRLVVAFAEALRDPIDDTDATALARFALIVMFTHADYGDDARRQFATALAAFDNVVVTVIADAAGCAFAIANGGDTIDDLRIRLAALAPIAKAAGRPSTARPVSGRN